MPLNPADDQQNVDLKKMKTKVMIQDALIKLKSRKGVSLQAIKKHLTENFDVNTERLNYVIKKSIKTGVEDGTYVQLKGKGASGSFKLADIKEALKKPKKKKESEKITKETKIKTVEDRKTTEKKEKTQTTTKHKENKAKKETVEEKVTKTKKEEVKKREEKGKKDNSTMAAKKMTPAKKRAMMMKRKSIGSIIKPPKMKPKVKK